MRLFYLSIFSFLLWSCGSDQAAAPQSNTPVADNSGYQITDIPGSNIKAAKMIDDAGMIKEDGFFLNDKKTGTWTTYYTSNKVKTMTNYVNGQKNGIFIQMSDRSYIEQQGYYLNDQLHGRQAKFGFGRKLEEETHYKNGVLDGVFKKYDKQGKLNREIHYQNGQLHGPNIFYNEGVKTVEYEYKNGKKVSGGIIEN